MKSLLLGLIIPLTIATCNLHKTPPPAVVPTPVTLDGLSVKEASQWINNIRADSSNTEDAISIWYSKDWIQHTRELLDTEKIIDKKIDGFRVYFAKNNNKALTLILTATKDAGPSPQDPSVTVHKDFFKLSKAVPPLRASVTDFEEEYGSKEGTRLYILKEPYPKSTCVRTSTNHVIPVEEAVHLVKQFDKREISTRSEWFGIDVIHTLDNELHKAPNADGVRVYFAKDNDGYSMIIFITTTKATTASGMVYHKDDFNCYTPENTKSPIFSPKWGGFDRGEKCPNFCDGDDLPCDTCGQGLAAGAKIKTDSAKK